jgi:hypothetical protein
MMEALELRVLKIIIIIAENENVYDGEERSGNKFHLLDFSGEEKKRAEEFSPLRGCLRNGKLCRNEQARKEKLQDNQIN